MTLNADLCILNYYDADGRMGLHQDKDESERSIAAGLPVVSVSLGDTARFLFGGTKRRDPVEALRLESGDAFVFGGPSRLRYHGVSRILPGTAPPSLGVERSLQPDVPSVRPRLAQNADVLTAAPARARLDYLPAPARRDPPRERRASCRRPS